MVTSPSNLHKPRESISTSGPYPSPPNSPRQTKPTNLQALKVPENESSSPGAVPLVLLSDSDPIASPQPLSPSTAHDEQEENKDDVSKLKTRLGLDSGLCGGLTKAGSPCKCRSPATNEVDIVAQLKSISELTQSSPGLDSALDELATLVHCSYHDSGAPKSTRIKAWKAEFPVGQPSTDPTASIQEQIRETLKLASTQCIGTSSRKQRCRKSIGGQKVQNCAATIAEIVKPEVYLDDASIDGLLKVLETNMFCHWHERQPLTKVGLWKSIIEEIWRKGLAQYLERIAPEKIESPSRSTDVQSYGRSPKGIGSDFALKIRGLSLPNSRRGLSTYWPVAYDTSPFEIIAKGAEPAKPESSYARVRSKMIEGLDPKDLISGHIYAYEVPGNTGYIKIGYTARSVEERHEEWEFDCNRLPKVLYPGPSVTMAKLPNARRVEKLCHAELNHRNIRIYCKSCLKQHLEWFEVSAEEAIAVIQKWSQWIATRPYQSIELRSGVKWTIREEERKRTLDMECFMKETSKAGKQTLAVNDVKVEVVQVSKSISDKDSHSSS